MKKADFNRYIKLIAKPTRYLISIAPEDKLDWRPIESVMPLGQLLWHLAQSAKDIGITANEDWPDTLEQQEWPSFAPKAALEKFDKGLEESLNAVEGLSEDDFYNKRIKMPWGDEDKMSMMLMLMCDHIIHHKEQLFLYLKQLGFDLNTMHLYYGESAD